MAGLTAAALASVGFLAYQAAAGVPAADTAMPDVRSSPARAAAGDASKAPLPMRNPAALPDRSGTGQRVVYSLDYDRVWLVDEDGRVSRTFGVTPGSVDPAPGTYRVTSRSNSVTGTDGTPIEHVVRFTNVKGVAVGFSAAVDGSRPVTDPTVKTGGIRETRPDGDAMWTFATIGEKVVVTR
ncbi:hypothetical protein AQJ84_31155 [Streptomyces resistomycificus]|uniref:L,D-transpeptidase n=1 Tax=Streptomyces resistomycificus TaxID=67356 RepID=A0A0L8KZW7_9ACTN|nr:hypothetical protein ADK37_30430 [Streptomyces resistomycificus]KUN93058.1 hypothetical protein AQJ84_31155 [Streptomyces resistomycificus]